ncbi:MAG: AbrB/MazE/SpoVT family DNA-binding domain-containing protein, partial [Gammaproteobacteria bacterium]|nr:AbrB/MazE/SpoVT family DNA-binding domain-containing protein [Gammaproteobacteria bacterium]
MPNVSAKRQITLPVDQCRQAHIEPGDEYHSYVDN